jgi:hypothetical protein
MCPAPRAAYCQASSIVWLRGFRVRAQHGADTPDSSGQLSRVARLRRDARRFARFVRNRTSLRNEERARQTPAIESTCIAKHSTP